MGIKITPTWREKKIIRHLCYNIQPWLTSWYICCCRVMLVWQTIDDRVWYWQWTFYISTSIDGPCSRNGHIHIYPLVILVKYSTSDYYSWSQILPLLFLKADVVAQLLMLSIVELLKSYIIVQFLKSEIVVELFPKLAIIVQFLKLQIVVKILKLNRVAEFLISVRYKVLFIKALLAIVYCIAQ